MASKRVWAGQLSELDRYLTEELGEDGAAFCRRWLAACAAYPLLRWPITLALGEALSTASKRPSPDEATHLALGRLEWFRDGRMPFAVRLVLVRSLDRADRRIVRNALTTILADALNYRAPAARRPGRVKKGGGPAGHRDERGYARWIANLVEELPDDALQADALLPMILRGQRPGRLGLIVAGLRRRLPARARAWTRPERLAALAAFAALFGLVVWARPYIRDWLDLSAPRKTEDFDVVRVTLSACGAPPGASGTIQVRGARDLRLETGVVMAPVDDQRDDLPFSRVLLDKDMTAIVTQNRDRTTRLWGLAGGSIILKGAPAELGAFGFVSGDAIWLAGRDRKVAGTWNLPSGRRDPGTPQQQALVVPWLNTAKLVRSRAGLPYSAELKSQGVTMIHARGGSIVIRSPSSPLVGLGVEASGARRLVVLNCDPAGVVQAAPAPPMPSSPGTRLAGLLLAADSVDRRWAPPKREGMRVVATYVVYFPDNSYDVPSAAEATIKQAAQAARATPGRIALATGHVDITHTREEGLALSARMANAVRDRLVANGLAASKVQTLAYGRERLEGPTDREDPIHRRSDIFIYAPGAPARDPVPSLQPDGAQPSISLSAFDVEATREVAASNAASSIDRPSSLAVERDITLLEPEARRLAESLIAKATAEGMVVRLLAGRRTVERQAELYASGRDKPGPWLTNARISTHNLGLSFDLALFKDGKLVENRADYAVLGALGKSLGLVWGGTFGFRTLCISRRVGLKQR